MNGAAPASTLAPGESATLSVSMLTSAAGQYSGNFVIPSNDPLVSNFTIPCGGDGDGAGADGFERAIYFFAGAAFGDDCGGFSAAVICAQQCGAFGCGWDVYGDV